MMRTFLAVLIFLSLAVFGCQGKKAQQLFDTAQLEELQNNHEHARSLYEEIVRNYPDSEVAAKARERLSAMRSGS
jgi:TolA-binding protein